MGSPLVYRILYVGGLVGLTSTMVKTSSVQFGVNPFSKVFFSSSKFVLVLLFERWDL